MELTSLPNIGKTLAEKLRLLDIISAEQLLEYTSEEVFIKIHTLDPNACINTLYAIEGAIANVRWHHLPDIRKKELLDFYKQMEKC